MMLTIDRKAFIDILSEGNDRIGGAMLPPPEGIWGLSAEQLADLPGYGGDIEKNREEGRKIMRELGYGPDKPLEVKVATRNLPLYRDPAVILIDHLKQVYIEGELDVVETSLWYAQMTRKDFTVAMNVSGIGIDDPDMCSTRTMPAAPSATTPTIAIGTAGEVRRAVGDAGPGRAQEAGVGDRPRAAAGRGPAGHLPHPGRIPAGRPIVKGITLAQNSQYNHWRLEDAWLDK